MAEYNMFQVSGPSFCAGIVFRNNRLVERAPILKRAPVVTLVGWHDYARRRGWALRWVSSWQEYESPRARILR